MFTTSFLHAHIHARAHTHTLEGESMHHADHENNFWLKQLKIIRKSGRRLCSRHSVRQATRRFRVQLVCDDFRHRIRFSTVCIVGSVSFSPAHVTLDGMVLPRTSSVVDAEYRHQNKKPGRLLGAESVFRSEMMRKKI